MKYRKQRKKQLKKKVNLIEWLNEIQREKKEKCKK